MEDEIRDKLKNINLIYVPIEKEKDLLNIYNLFINKHHFEPETSIEMLYLGGYYNNIEKNDELCEKYYLMGVEKGNTIAISNLAIFYENIRRNYDLAEKYYLMGAEKDDVNAISDLATFYEDIRKNYDSAEKYYLMAIEKDNMTSINDLNNLYSSKNMIFKKMILSITHADHFPRNIVISNITNVWNNLKGENSSEFINSMIKFDFNEEDNVPLNLLLFVNSIKNQLSLMDLHFEYSLQGHGYEKAKEDFLSKITKKTQIQIK